MHDVALQRHQSERVPPAPHDFDARVEVFGNHGSSEQVFHNAAVLLVKLDQFAGPRPRSPAWPAPAAPAG